MKLLHTIPSTNPISGGPIEGVKQLQPALQKLNIHTEIVCCDAPDAPWLKPGSHTVHALGPSHLHYSFTPRLIPWLRENVKRFDAVIINGIWQYHSFAAWRVLAGSGIPYFVFTHGMLDPWFRRAYPLKHLKKWLYWPWAEYRVLRDAKAVLFTSEEERMLARQSFRLYRAHEAVTAYGIAPAPATGQQLAEEFLTAHPMLRGKRIVLFLGRIHEKKGCDILLDAFAAIAHRDERIHLVMAGPDQTHQMAGLKAQADRLGIGYRVTWPGMLQGTAKWGAYYAAEAFCLPSHQENFGIVVAEALACGKAVLISNKVNIWREIDADAAGFIDEDTKEGTIRNLNRWLALDKETYGLMAERARQCFTSRFHIDHAAAELAKIIFGAAAHAPDRLQL